MTYTANTGLYLPFFPIFLISRAFHVQIEYNDAVEITVISEELLWKTAYIYLCKNDEWTFVQAISFLTLGYIQRKIRLVAKFRC